jgi:hypothetical protein
MPIVYRPVLLVEGHGDQQALPELLRRIVADRGLFQITPAPRPIKSGEIAKLRRPGQLERFIVYGCSREDGDGVLLVLDCDDECPREVADEFLQRINTIKPAIDKPVGIAFLKREFESLFLVCAHALAAQYPECVWNFDDFSSDADMEEIRAAKQLLNRLMKVRTYKETRDQVRFVNALDLIRLRARSRSFRHLESTIEWMAGVRNDSHQFYPVIAKQPAGQ